VRRLIEDPVAVYIWLLGTVGGLACMFIFREPKLFIVGWAAGGLAASVCTHIRVGRGR